jgi:hypothetical protein
VTDSTPGDGISYLSEIVGITNHTASALEFHLFQYNAFDLLGTTANQSLSLQKTRYAANATQTMQGTSWKATQSATAAGTSRTPQSDVATDSSLLDSLNDSAVTTLLNSTGTNTLGGTGSLNYVFEFDYSGIAALGGVGISETFLVQVPEPAVGVLLSMGIGGLMLRRRLRI